MSLESTRDDIFLSSNCFVWCSAVQPITQPHPGCSERTLPNWESNGPQMNLCSSLWLTPRESQMVSPNSFSVFRLHMSHCEQLKLHNSEICNLQILEQTHTHTHISMHSHIHAHRHTHTHNQAHTHIRFYTTGRSAWLKDVVFNEVILKLTLAGGRVYY